MKAAALLLFARLCFAAQPATQYEPVVDEAMAALYSSDFDGAQRILDRYIQKNPGDPLAYSVKASGYVFWELHRLGILEADFFKDDRIADKRKSLKPDPAVRAQFDASIKKAQELAGNVLRLDPDNVNALFASCLAYGNQTDYLALIEKKQMQGLSVNKEGYRVAQRLLKIAPDFYDAHLTTGLTEYLIGSIPFVFRWFVKFDDVQGDKKQGIRKLELVAERGHYLKTFAKILLATAAVREKRPRDAQRILQELTQAYPRNALLRRELDRISTQL